jgi:parallel beta-helix repeat protein
MIVAALRHYLAALLNPTSTRTRRLRARLAVTMLEDRWVPAVLSVGPGDPYATIQAAVNAANPGDTVQVDAGTYQEQVTINKCLTLMGHDHSTIILAPTTLGAADVANPDAIVRVTGAGTFVQIAHLMIEGAAAGTPNLYYGVRVDGNAGADIGNCNIANIIDSSDPGIGVAVDIGNNTASPDGTGAQVGTAKVHNDTITNYQRAGVVVSNTGSSAMVENNTIAGGAASVAPSVTGVEVSDGAVAHVKNNAISGNFNGSEGTGVLLFNPGTVSMGSHHCDDDDCITDGGDNTPDQGCLVTTVENNTITGNDYGIFGGQVTAPGTKVSNNHISGNTYVGIEFDYSSNVTINNNQLSGNGSQNTADGGIYLFQSTGNTLSNNQSNNNNGSGIYIDAGSTGNLLQNNLTSGNVYINNPSVEINADAVDLSVGSGTAGTGNTWTNNQGQTFITVSGQSVFKKSPKAHH